MPIKTPQYRRWIQHQQGTALIEFAFALPLLLVLFLGAVEVTRMFIISSKVQNVAFTMADLVTQGNTVSEADLANFADAATQLMKPYPFDGTIIFSAIALSELGAPAACPSVATEKSCITWQRSYGNQENSHIGTVNTIPVLPNGFSLNAGQSFIVAEVFYNYTQIIPQIAAITNVVLPSSFYRIALYSPRDKALSTLTPDAQ